MSKVYNILVFPGGTEIGLEIHKALCQCKDIRLFSAGLDVSNHAPFVYARHFLIPSIHDEGWLERLNRVLADNAIDYIFPAYDDILVALLQNQDAIKAKVVSSPLETAVITRSKSMTYNRMAGFLPVPEVYPDAASVDLFPVFVKPDKGQGSYDTHVVRNKVELAQLFERNKGRIITEYLPGAEYTVDCFSDRAAGLLFCCGRERVRTKSGISMNSKIADFQDVFSDYARVISSRLVFHGAWFFQVKKDRDGVLKLLEVAPRIAGTMALHRAQGINLPLLSIYEQERVPVVLMRNNTGIEIDRALVNRYRQQIEYAVVYVDLDDTLILNDKVNVPLISFLYQCLNKGKRVVLITKHDKDLKKTLEKYRLNNIFDEVIHLDRSDSKADHIDGHDAIFIDDSFSERKKVSEKLGIYTFDCSMLEVLLDERA
ncbi:hypothetical protein BAC1_02163 [uncultured bacterium]|nr:hypothetical protein BAC1_02163 [uncultured bacterium]